MKTILGMLFWFALGLGMFMASFAFAETPQHQLERVNQSINGSHPAGWVCKDYAFAKNAELRREGFPSNELHIAAVTTEDGTPHMVLIADVGSKQIVLDNRYVWTEDWNDLARTGYKMVSLWP